MWIPVYLDVPTCPGCDTKALVPVAHAHWNHRANPGDRLVCPACGSGCVGTDVEVTQAERAQAAWDRKRDREQRAEGRRQDRLELERRLREAVAGEATWRRAVQDELGDDTK